MTVTISKFEATGNDFILILDLDDELDLTGKPARALCDRWVGVGEDGVFRVTGGCGEAPFAMRLINADGTPAQMSGNGIRCTAAFLAARGLLPESESEVKVWTASGVKLVSIERGGGVVVRATVSMGEPAFARAAIPMHGPAWETFLDQPFDIGGTTVPAGAVSMGNPHLVLFVDDDPERYHVAHTASALEHHELFPERTNVEFARVRPGGVEIDVRVWERGVGETLSCGTGACAVAVLANESGRSPSQVTIHYPGGDLRVTRQPDGQVLLSGGVSHVFDGTVDLPALLS
ncbi:MAG: diaminopimelate epimerase [Actinomycetota bacterium]|nr:diaminopimelate epimerase [Actinomycetota bacterium]